jgi:PAS domain S-box-containing protein
VLGTHRISDYVTATGRRHFEAGRSLVTSGLGLGPLLSTPPEVLAELGYGSFVDVPRLSGGQWRFMLTAARAAPGEWRPDEVELLEQLATRLYARLERAQAETALQAAHTQLVGVLENTHDAFYSLDAQSRFTYINHRAAQLWGRAPGTLIGQSFWQAFPQAVGSEAYHQHQQVLQTRQPTHFEVVSPVLGTWIEVSIYPGQDGGLSVFFRDITARKQAEARQAFWLRLSEALRPLQDPAAIQQAAMATLGPHLGLSRAYYTEILPDGDTIITRSGYCHGVPAVVGPHRLSDFGPALRQTLLAGTTVVVHDVLREPAPPAAAQPTFAALQLRAAVGVPLVKAGRLLGVLVASQATPRQWQRPRPPAAPARPPWRRCLRPCPWAWASPMPRAN